VWGLGFQEGDGAAVLETTTLIHLVEGGLKYGLLSQTLRSYGTVQTVRGHQGGGAAFISVKLLINCVWRNKMYYINALLLPVWSLCVVIFVAQKQ